jgi:hypothetical protein
MSSMSSDGSIGLKARLREEFFKYLLVSGYLYVCFVAVQLYKAGVLQHEGIRYLPLGVAAMKALVLGKFLLVGDALSAVMQLHARTPAIRILARVGVLLIVLVALTLLEEAAVAAWHGQPIPAALAELGGSALVETLASILMLLLVLVPLVAADEVGRALGPGGLPRWLMHPPAYEGDGARRN